MWTPSGKCISVLCENRIFSFISIKWQRFLTLLDYPIKISSISHQIQHNTFLIILNMDVITLTIVLACSPRRKWLKWTKRHKMCLTFSTILTIFLVVLIQEKDSHVTIAIEQQIIVQVPINFAIWDIIRSMICRTFFSL